MSSPKVRVETAETEAAAWHTRLGAASVTTREIEEFFAWRQAPANADAYRRVEHFWGETRKLAADPDVGSALDAVTAKGAVRRKVRSMPLIISVAAVSAAAALAFGGWSWWQALGVYDTGVGEQRSVQLADGSTVRLDTASRIRVRFARGERLVDLESGQALFQVAHDPSRPFVVRAGDTAVTAVGTVFDVRRRADGARVVLVSGMVDVAVAGPDPKKTRLQAGQKAEVERGRAVVAATDVAAGTSWTDGRMVFRDAPLAEAVAEVNRYLTDKVEIAPGAGAGARVNGVFKTGDRDAFVSTAVEVFGLRAARQADGGVRLTEPSK